MPYLPNFENYTYFLVKIRKIYANEIHKFYVKTIPFLRKIFEQNPEKFTNYIQYILRKIYQNISIFFLFRKNCFNFW